jgi:hypothetical protein
MTVSKDAAACTRNTGSAQSRNPVGRQRAIACASG